VNMTMRESVSFPKDHGFTGADGWAELVLPPPRGTDVAGQASTYPQRSGAISYR